MTGSAQLTRNAGPSWGLQFLSRTQRIVPRWLLWPALKAGTWVAVARMPRQRRLSREFLTTVWNRPAGLIDVWRHFFSFVELLMVRLQMADQGPGRCTLAPEWADEFEGLMKSGEPALFGTFHFGYSDLLGFMLSTRGRHVSMVRLRMGNSPEMAGFTQHFGDAVSFIWVNEPDDLLFALKAALDAGHSLAMQCDRYEYSAKTEAFEFLGARRVFPFTIYHLAVMYRRPVMFCIGVPDGAGGTRVFAMPLYRPAAVTREENLARAHVHFQGVLTRFEALVREQPLLWFNFQPLNPVATNQHPGEPLAVGADKPAFNGHTPLDATPPTFKVGSGT